MFSLLSHLAELTVYELEGRKLLEGARPLKSQVTASGHKILVPPTAAAGHDHTVREPQPGSLSLAAAGPPTKQQPQAQLMPAAESWQVSSARDAAFLPPCCSGSLTDDRPADEPQDSGSEAGAASVGPVPSLQRVSPGHSSTAGTESESRSGLRAWLRRSRAEAANEAREDRSALPGREYSAAGQASSRASLDLGSGSPSLDTTISQLSRAELRGGSNSGSLASAPDLAPVHSARITDSTWDVQEVDAFWQWRPDCAPDAPFGPDS